MRILFVEFAFEKLFNSAVAALSAFLKREGHEVELLCTGPKTSADEYCAELGRRSFDLLAFSCMSFQWEGVKRCASLARTVTGAPIIVGGYHPTFWPEEVIGEEGVDILCRGEGEGAMLDLVRALQEGRDTTAIPNLWVKRDGVVHRNPLRPTIGDLDTLPYWDREIYDFDRFLETVASITIFHEKYIIPVAAGRGCPYTCTYCSNTALLQMYKGNGRFTRHRSVPHLLGELEGLVRRFPKVRFFEFWDEIFALNPRWLEEFSARYRDSVGLPFSVFLRIEQCSDHSLGLLADANCRLVLLGVEAGNEEYRAKYLNRKMANRRIVEAFARIRHHGLESVALNMIGLPHETPELVRETIELNREIDPDLLCVFVYQAFPGTPLHDLCLEQGLLPPVHAPMTWYEEPDCALQQTSISREELMACFQEFRELQWEIERKRGKRGQTHEAELSESAR